MHRFECLLKYSTTSEPRGKKNTNQHHIHILIVYTDVIIEWIDFFFGTFNIKNV